MVRRAKRELPEFCSWNTDRHGKRRIRFRQLGFSTYLSGVPWSDDFMREYHAALQGVKVRRENVGAERTKPGSMNAVIVSYYRTADWAGLRQSTKGVRRGIIERFRTEHGDKQVRNLKQAHIKAIMAKMANTPDAANNLLKVLRLLLNEAIAMELIASNPAIGIKKYRIRGDGIHTWTEDEIKAFEAKHGIGTKARLAMALLLYTAQRKSDVVRTGWQHVDNASILIRQQKTDTPLRLPIHPDLRMVLEGLPKTNMTFIVTDQGAPFTAAGFGNWFRDRCDEAGLPQCSAHGLRKSAATRLANAGCSEDMIKAVTGHAGSEVRRYTKAANQARLAEAAIQAQIRAEQEQSLSNPPTRLDKSEAK